jgi:hypothetical protein
MYLYTLNMYLLIIIDITNSNKIKSIICDLKQTLHHSEIIDLYVTRRIKILFKFIKLEIST